MTKSEILKNTHKSIIKWRLLTIMDPKGDQKCSTLSPRNASLADPGQSFCSTVANYSHWAPTDYQKAVKMSLIVAQKVIKSIHLTQVNQSQQRPLIQSNFTASARKQTKPCTQIRYKTLPLSRPSRMFVTLKIDLQLCNWKTLFHWTPSNSIGYEIT